MKFGRPSCEEDLEGLYDAVYTDRPDYGELVGRHAIVRRALMKWVPKTGWVLDAGCGRGSLARTLVDEGYPFVIGTEISQTAIDLADEDLRIMKLPYSRLVELGPERFDAVISCDVLEHLTTEVEILNALEALAGVSREWLFITVVCHNEFKFTHGLDLEAWDGDLHLIKFDRGEWRDRIEQVMYIEDESEDSYGHTFFFFGRTRAAWDRKRQESPASGS